MKKFKEIILETDNLKAIHMACMDALVNKKMIAIIGSAGLGKTTALASFKSIHPDIVYMVKAQKSMNARIFYSTLSNSIGDDSYQSTLPIYFCIRKAANIFNEDSSNKLLIIDEAGKFSPTMLEFLHEFRDLTMGTTGIVLAGVEYFQTNLERWNDSNRNGIPEVYSRIGAWQPLSKPKYSEVLSLIRAYGIKDAEFERFNKGVSDFRVLTNRISNYKTVLEEVTE